MSEGATVFAAAGLSARELPESDVFRLQGFFHANPEYFLATAGEPADPFEAQREYDEYPPAHLGWTRRFLLGLYRDDGELDGVAIVVKDLGGEAVWHIALFIVATALHGRGVAGPVHGALEAWAKAGGAEWMRLGVVAGNARAERFWEKCGYAEVRTREGVPAGSRANTVRVMVKPLGDGTLEAYLERCPRDRPGSALP